MSDPTARLYAKAHPELQRRSDEKENKNPAFRRNLQRAVADQCPEWANRRFRRHGSHSKAKDTILREQRPPQGINGEWGIDFKDLHVRCVNPETGEIENGKICVVVEHDSGCVLGVAFGFREDAVLARRALWRAMVRTPEKSVGGVPRVLIFDSGLPFLSTGLADVYDHLAILPRPTPGYRAEFNGATEAFNGALEKEFCSLQGAYTHGPSRLDGKSDRGDRHAGPAVALEAKLLAFCDDWTYLWRVPDLGHRTRAEFFRDQGGDVRDITPEELAVAMFDSIDKPVGPNGVTIGTGDHYAAHQFAGLHSKTVAVHVPPEPRPDVVWIRRGRDVYPAFCQETGMWAASDRAKARAAQQQIQTEWQDREARLSKRAEFVADAERRAAAEFDARERAQAEDAAAGVVVELESAAVAPDGGDESSTAAPAQRGRPEPTPPRRLADPADLDELIG